MRTVIGSGAQSSRAHSNSPEESRLRAEASVRICTSAGMGRFTSTGQMAGINRTNPGSGKEHLLIRNLSSSANRAR